MATSRRPVGWRASAAPLCLIPARGGSKRFPRKNIAPLNGRPLISYSITAALESNLFDAVYVSTEDPEIAKVARVEGAEVLERPADLAADRARMVDVGVHTLDTFREQGRDFDSICMILATAAFITADDLRGGWALMRESRANAVMAVTDFYEHPYSALKPSGKFVRPAFPLAMRQTQHMPHFQVDVGSFYFMRADVLRERMSFYVPRLAAYPIPRLRAVDIDEPYHLRLAEALSTIETAEVV